MLYEVITYAAEVEVKPELEVKGYTGLSLEKEKFVADPKVIEERIEEMRASRAEMVTSKRKVVITSYSIHYTKLYERRRGDSACPPSGGDSGRGAVRCGVLLATRGVLG